MILSNIQYLYYQYASFFVITYFLHISDLPETGQSTRGVPVRFSGRD